MKRWLFFACYTAVKVTTMLTITNPFLTASADLGIASFNGTLTSATGANVNLQLYVEQTDRSPATYLFVPVAVNNVPTTLSMFPGMANPVNFTVPLPKGTYGQVRVIGFVAGTNFSQVAFDIFLPSLNLTVTTSNTRIVMPVIDDGSIVIDETSADGKLHVKFNIKYPLAFTDQYSAFWVQEDYPFTQVWFPFSGAKHATDPLDNYELLPCELVTPMPAAGVYTPSFGVFDYNWNKEEWDYRPITYEVGGGSWVQKADSTKYPKISEALALVGKAPYAILGNLGNFDIFGDFIENTVGIFSLLKAAGLASLRVNFDQDKVRQDVVHQHKLDSLVQNMLSAGIVPCIAPQDLCHADDGLMADRIANHTQLVQWMATTYKGVPVILDPLNEPHDFPTWTAWKPVLESFLTAMRAIDTNAFLCAPLEGYSESGAAANLDPLPTGLANIYTGHSYHSSPAQLAAAYGGNLPTWIQEYHSTDSAFHLALAAMPNIKAISAWAWCKTGEDNLNLISAINGAVIDYTADGQALLALYAQLKAGTAVSVPVVNPPVPPGSPPTTGSPPATGSGSTGLSLADIDTEIQKVLNAAGFELAADVPPAIASALAAYWNAHQADLKTMMDAEIAAGLAALTTQMATLKSQQALLAAAELKLVGKTGGLTNADLQAVIAPLQAAIASLTTQVQADEAKMKPVLDLLAG